uniref:NADP-dependent oxidoreductase domain-containing protein n=1 Tax=Ditylenchus dipsaci TaxID=166011 RepID=A0A915EGX3_9BILA
MSSPRAITLSNGLKMPVIGLGTWLSTPEEISLAVSTALDAGYLIQIKREDIFLVTKLWCTHNYPSEIEDQVRESLSKLKTDYVDLYLCHFPVTFKHDMSGQDHTVKVEDIWKALESVYEKGLVKSIGVSNFSIEQIERVMKIAKVPIHNLQVECHLYFGQFELQQVCKKYNISLCAYSPIGSAGRKNFVLPDGVKPEWPDTPYPMEDSLVVSLAKKYNKSPAQILLRHLVQRDIIAIPKSTNKKRIAENFQIFDFELSSEDMKQLNSVPQRPRVFTQPFMAGSPEDAFKDERPKA